MTVNRRVILDARWRRAKNADNQKCRKARRRQDLTELARRGHISFSSSREKGVEGRLNLRQEQRFDRSGNPGRPAYVRDHHNPGHARRFTSFVSPIGSRWGGIDEARGSVIWLCATSEETRTMQSVVAESEAMPGPTATYEEVVQIITRMQCLGLCVFRDSL